MPINIAPLITIVAGKKIILFPGKLSLIFSIMNCENSRYVGQLIEGMAILHHKGNKAGLVIVAMHNIGFVIPFAHPVANGCLKTNPALGVVIVAINFFAVKQSMNIYQIQFKPQLVGFFLNDGILELMPRQVLVVFE